MKTKLFILLTVTVFYQAKAQVFYSRTYNRYGVKNRTIIFSPPKVDAKDEKVIAESDFKALIKKYWTYSDKYEILPYEEAVKKGKDEKDKTILAYFKANTWIKGDGVGDIINEFRLEVPKSSANYTVRVFLEDKITESDIVYALELTQFMLKGHTEFTKSYIWKASSKIYGTELKSKTLLANKDNLTKITKEEIKKIYPYKFEVVDKSVIDTAIMNKDSNYLIIYAGKLLFDDGTSKPFDIVFQPEKGAIVSWSSSKMLFGNTGLRNEFTDKTFKDFVKNAGL